MYWVKDVLKMLEKSATVPLRTRRFSFLVLFLIVRDLNELKYEATIALFDEEFVTILMVMFV